MSSALGTIERKLTKFRNDPLGVLKRRALFAWRETVRGYAAARERTVLSFPVYNFFYWYLNRTAKKLFQLEQPRMAVAPVQHRMLDELGETGITVLRFEDLFPERRFSEFQERAEQLVHASAVLAKIEAITAGEKAVSDPKFYLIRPLGYHPIYDANDSFLRLALSAQLLGIVCNYLGMFTRLIHLEHWYNVATEGPATYSQRWHRDPDDKKLVKMFLYLRDVDQNTGPFTYIPESHNGGRFGRIFPQTTYGSHYPPDGKVDERFSQSQIKVCTGKAGTMILCDTSGLHRGGHPTKNGRLLFTCTYTSNATTIRNEALYSLSNGPNRLLSPAAQYAIGHLRVR